MSGTGGTGRIRDFSEKGISVVLKGSKMTGKEMKRLLFLCILSGFVSAVMAVLIFRAVEQRTTAENWPYKGYQVPVLNSPAEPASSVIPGPTGGITQEQLDGLFPEEQQTVLLYERQNKSVVNIDTVMVRTQPFFMAQEAAKGLGSGIVLNKQGIILTNFHVAEGADAIKITLFDGSNYPAKMIASDPNTDIALLKIDAPVDLLYPVEFGDSSKLLIGQKVYAIGSPFGLQRTMTSGIISNLNQVIESQQEYRLIKGVIQIDAAINPGNSGGLLLDSRGRMIGMNTAIASHVQESSGVGFAIPVNTIHRIVSILLEKGQVVRGDAGVVQVAETEYGLVPVLIDDGGAADRAGLRGQKQVIVIRNYNGQRVKQVQTIVPEGGFDIITGVDNKPVQNGEDFIAAIEDHSPGETVQLNIIRDGKNMNLPMTLD